MNALLHDMVEGYTHICNSETIRLSFFFITYENHFVIMNKIKELSDLSYIYKNLGYHNIIGMEILPKGA